MRNEIPGLDKVGVPFCPIAPYVWDGLTERRPNWSPFVSLHMTVLESTEGRLDGIPLINLYVVVHDTIEWISRIKIGVMLWTCGLLSVCLLMAVNDGRMTSH